MRCRTSGLAGGSLGRANPVPAQWSWEHKIVCEVSREGMYVRTVTKPPSGAGAAKLRRSLKMGRSPVSGRVSARNRGIVVSNLEWWGHVDCITTNVLCEIQSYG
jgi:hypothetical protein